MKNVIGCIALASAVGCTSSGPADPHLGTGDFARNGTSLGVTAVWAQPSYAFFGSSNASYGGYAITFATAASGTSCSGIAALSGLQQLDLSTPQVFTPTSGGHPTIAVGNIPVVDRPLEDAPPAMTVAEFYASTPTMTAGTVTITSFDEAAIVGTFTATGPDASNPPSSVTTFTGSFDATICPSR